MARFGKWALAGAMATATLTMAVAAPAFAKDDKKEAKAPKLKNSKAFVVAYEPVVILLQAGDIAGAKAASDAAVAAIETEDDKFIAGNLLLSIADKPDPKDYALAIRGFDLLLASASVEQAEKPALAFKAGLMAFNLKEYAQVVKYMDMAKSMGYSSPEMFLIGGQARLTLGDAAGYEDMRSAVTAKIAAGEVPPEQWLRLTASSAEKSKNSAELLYWTRAMVQYYPTKENWRLALGIYEGEAQIPQDAMVDLFRLRRKTETLISEADYAGYIESVSLNGLILLPQEAIDTLQEGINAGVLSASTLFVKESLADAKSAMADDKANSAAREKKAIASSNGRSILSAADVALNYGNYERAVELYDLAAQNGMDANVTNMRKGIALFELGNPAGAKAAFSAVSGSPRSDIASFWTLLIDLENTPAQ